MVLAEIKADLESAGFEVFPPCILPACSKNAPHKRERLWIIAHAINSRYKAGREQKAETNGIQRISRKEMDAREFNGTNISSANSYANGKPIKGWQETRDIEIEGKITKQFFARYDKPFSWYDFPTQSPVCGGNDGVSNRVDRIKGLGNAVVPQVVYEIFKAIEKTSS